MLLHRPPIVKTPVFRLMFLIILFIMIFFLFNDYNGNQIRDYYVKNDIDKFNKVSYISHWKEVEKYYQNRENWKTSNLGSILFKNNEERLGKGRKNKTFTILVWKHWEFLKNRHVYYFGTSSGGDPLDGCSVENCQFVGDDKFLDTADAVIVHVHRGLIPKVTKRNPNQRWVFLNDEAPPNAFQLAKKPPKLTDLVDIFNWSMTYRSDSDIPVPYGRTVSRYVPVWSEAEETYDNIATLVPNWKNKRRDVLAAILISHCSVKSRIQFLDELSTFMPVDVHGKCSKDISKRNSCPGHYRADCTLLSEYLFYLVLENSMCDQYLTEKIFYHAYSRGAIPVIRGPGKEDCENMLPPNSFLYIDDFASVEELAKTITEIGKDDEKLLSYHKWRNHFVVLNEHGYFGSKSYHLCRICEAMNYNDETPSVYNLNDIRKFFDAHLQCHT